MEKELEQKLEMMQIQVVETNTAVKDDAAIVIMSYFGAKSIRFWVIVTHEEALNL